MPLELRPDSHLGHGIVPSIINWLIWSFQRQVEPFKVTIQLPSSLADLYPVNCGLYGPIMGDQPVRGVRYLKRGNRAYTSRVWAKPLRPVDHISIIAGPHDGKPCVLYTVFGGPITPKEYNDPTISTEAERELCAKFWSTHALAYQE